MHGRDKEIVDTLEHGKNPNFLLVVVLSGVALIGLFIAAWLLEGIKEGNCCPVCTTTRSLPLPLPPGVRNRRRIRSSRCGRILPSGGVPGPGASLFCRRSHHLYRGTPRSDRHLVVSERPPAADKK